MKTFNKLVAVTLGLASLAMAGCSDFDEVNTNPAANSPLLTPPYYLLAQAIQNSQQNPDTAERTFVINWLSISRIADAGYDTSLGSYDDGYLNTCYATAANAAKSATWAINVANEHLEAGSMSLHNEQFVKNTIAYSRIWRVYAMSEFADSFGPMPIDMFQGVNPKFVSLKDVYYYFMDELRAAVADIDLTFAPTSDEAKNDHAYGWNPEKWKKYGISMWMRLAMRMSEADPAKAKTEFEAAVAAGDGIKTADEAFTMPENTGWDDFSGVMSRGWNYLMINATITNLMTNFGSSAQTGLDAAKSYYTKMDYARYEPYVKDASKYLGQDMSDYCETNSDNPTAGMFFDGLPSKIDPRAFVYFVLPNDGPDRKVKYLSNMTAAKALCDNEYMMEKNAKGEKVNIPQTEICKKYAFNGLPAGWSVDLPADLNGLYNGSYQADLDKYVANPDGTYPDPDNKVEKPDAETNKNYQSNPRSWGYIGSWPMIANEFRGVGDKGRLFFGPWETYFLLAEAAELGWTVGTTAKEAYEAGIKASFDYYGIGAAYSEYIASTDYNRVGTSVAFDHVAEPANYEIEYVDILGVVDENGELVKETKKMQYKYPNPANILYSGGKLNDHRTKILTQKYIANAPWLPLECWSDWRRTGLPFFERPCGTEAGISYIEFSKDQWDSKAQPGQYVQRMRYPASLRNADPEEFQHALELLGDPENTGKTPLWWAIGGNK